MKNKKGSKAPHPDNRKKKKRRFSPEDREILKMLRAYQIALYGEEWVRYQDDKRANKIKDSVTSNPNRRGGTRSTTQI